MDRRITIQAPIETLDEYNANETTGWTDFYPAWSEVKEEKGRENFESDQITPVRNTIFKVRYKAGITEKMRVLYNTRYYDIQSITEPNRKGTIEIKAKLLDEV